MQGYRIVETLAGRAGFVASRRGLQRVYLPEKTAASVRRRIAREFPESVEDPALLPALAADFAAYFAGEPVEFDVPIDWTRGGAFETAVWQLCHRVPYGETVTYKTLADRLGRPGGARAVGMAMAHNPMPLVVPCHRVLKSDGSLGGFSGPGGVSQKRRMLEMEAATAPA